MSSSTINEKFNSVYCEHLHKVRHFCFSYIQDKEICEDITQDVFETLWQRRESVVLDSTVLPYLLVIAKNKCLNALAKDKVKSKYTWRRSNSSKDDINSFALNELSVSKLYSEEIRKIYSDALDSMSPLVKETYIKIRVDKLKYKEVAEKEGVSVKTLERRITIATSILRKYLREYIKIVVLLLTSLYSV